jgi:hypothetical protein
MAKAVLNIIVLLQVFNSRVELLRRGGARGGSFAFLLQHLFGAFLVGLTWPRIHAFLPGQALSGFTQCIPDSKVNRLAFPRSMIRIFV